MRRYMHWLWLLLAGLLLLVANGANAIPLAAWLAPVFLLHFVRMRRARVGLPLAFLVLAATYAFQFRGMIPLPLPIYLAYIAFFGLVLVAPYALDRWLTSRLTGWPTLFVFPLAWVAVEYLNSFNISGTLGSSIAYSQYGQLPLLQLLSVTGLWGITFLVGWFATTVNAVWERWPQPKRAAKVAGVFALVLTTIVLLGGLRMGFYPPTSESVRIAGLTRAPIGVDERNVTKHLREQTATPEELQRFRKFAQSNNNDLIRRAEREARAGAKIVAWGEANALILKEDEPAFIKEARALAKKHEIYLAMGVVSWDNNKQDRPAENKIVMVAPDGAAKWQYLKTHPIPGPEMAQLVKGDGELKGIDTPYGRLTALICFDADFQRLAMQAGQMRADILLNPSSDWEAITPLHAQVASFRSIEQGVNQIRPASEGLSAAYDYQGRVLAANSYFQNGSKDIVAYVPVKGERTVYSVLGDWLAWASILGLGIVAFIAIRKKRG